ncbi:hypothetical protein PVK06_008640 [Gossypium arboreum]|uniref:Uncharacterized protein n=1 Tax=Gossypium arboreum TaxID=29729 RepID=A0ABR0QKH7_GOSAR|nr:hypothetical protein PVK06_008640 [Gossypium arboreum]
MEDAKVQLVVEIVKLPRTICVRGQFFCSCKYIFQGIDVPRILHLHVDINTDPDVDTCIVTNDDTDTDAHATFDASVDTGDYADGGSSMQPLAVEAKDTRWEPRTTQQSTIEDNNGAGVAEDEAQEPLLGEGGCDDGADEEVYRPAPSDPRRNPLRNHRPPPCGSHSPRKIDWCIFFYD